MPTAATISGVRALGRLLGISHDSAARCLNHPAWEFGRGPWRAELAARMKAWRADNIPPEPGAADRVSPGSALSALNKASLMKKIEDAKLTRARRGIVEREYHRVDTCNSTYRAWVIAQRDYLLALADRLPAATDEQKRWLADEIDQALRIFASSG